MTIGISERSFEKVILGTLVREMISRILLDVSIKNLRRQGCRLELWNV